MRTIQNKTAYLSGFGMAVGSVVFLVWINLAVGIIGTEADPANRMYLGVLAVGIGGAVIARFQPDGMARAMIAMACAQALVALIAIVQGLGMPWSGPAELVGVNAMFIALYSASAHLFRRAARGT